jgi:hypothetical protein
MVNTGEEDQRGVNELSAYGTDKQFREWVQRQPSCISGRHSEWLETGEGRCIAAHIRTDFVFTPQISGARSFLHFIFFLICLYFGFFSRPKGPSSSAGADRDNVSAKSGSGALIKYLSPKELVGRPGAEVPAAVGGSVATSPLSLGVCIR